MAYLRAYSESEIMYNNYMSLVQAAIFGIVEGFTEFLPVSSTAHLIFLSEFLNLSQNELVSFFEVFIQSGAILAVVLLYSGYLFKHRQLIPSIILSFIPTAIIGFLAHGVIKTVFFPSLELITGSMIIVGGIFIFVEMLVLKKIIVLDKKITQITPAHAFLIGLCQAIAIIPGVSRAGAVILSMIFLKYKRTDAAIYSFLLAVPTIIGASVLDFLKTDFSVFTQSYITVLFVGFVTSFISALIFIKWLIRYLQEHTLIIFGIYRIVVGVSLLLMFQHL